MRKHEKLDKLENLDWEFSTKLGMVAQLEER